MRELIDRLLSKEELFVRLEWFIRLRWVFLLGLGLSIALTRLVLSIALPYRHILVLGGIVLAYNTALYLHHSFFTRNRPPDITAARIEANIQIGADLLALTAMIHFSGGAENPFIFFYLFHAIIGSILLSRIEVWTHASLAYGLFLVVVSLEYRGIIPHYSLDLLIPGAQHQNLLYLLAVSVALLVTLVGTIYMTSSIAHSLRARKRELVLTRKMLQKKSQDLEEVNRELREKQAQLVQSEKLASLGQLSAGVAHEINNPIQFIQGNLRVLDEAMETILPLMDRHAERDPDFSVARLKYPFFRQHVKTLLDDMHTGALRIADIVRDLKKFARLDEGRMDETVDVNEVVRSGLRLVQNKIKRYRVIEDLDPALPSITGCTSKIEQVVVSNLINAAEALSGRPDGMITVSAKPEGGGKGILLSIADNGPGVPESVRDKVFDPFFTTKQRTGGTGLGLSIAYAIVNEHGGRAEVASTPGEGTTFMYHFPMKRVAG
ncbi:MAG TPA: ATP-binding protein [Candidatus Methylomirabilis sp.]|nr:ATP-binding protein [Candidatus Methylomirabilis sp.]